MSSLISKFNCSVDLNPEPFCEMAILRSESDAHPTASTGSGQLVAWLMLV